MHRHPSSEATPESREGRDDGRSPLTPSSDPDDDPSPRWRAIRAILEIVSTTLCLAVVTSAIVLGLHLNGDGVPAVSKVLLASLGLHLVLGIWLMIVVGRLRGGMTRLFWSWAASTVALVGAIAWSSTDAQPLSRRAILVCGVALVSLTLAAIDLREADQQQDQRQNQRQNTKPERP